jgi:hypothetical protein
MKRNETQGKTFQLALAIIVLAMGLTLILSPINAANTVQLTSDQWIVYDDALVGNKLSALSANSVWMLYFGNNVARVYHWDGTTWSNTGNLSHTQDIIRGDIQMVSETDGWVVLGGPLGESASSVIYRWNGNSWSHFETYTDPNEVSMSAIDMVSANDGWIVATGSFWANYYRWNGTTWTRVATSTGWPDSDIKMVSSTDGWSVGLGGRIDRWNGANWSSVSSPVGASLNGVEMLSATEGWAVGDNGTILYWNGTAWSQVSSPTSTRLFDVSMLSSSHGWAVGDNGVLLRWAGTNWSLVSSPVNNRLTSVQTVSETDGWAVGWGGLLRYSPVFPEMAINYSTGAPGSYFTFTGTDFPVNDTATISVNGVILGSVDTGENGTFQFWLSTDSAASGAYFVTASINPSATVRFDLSPNAPVHSQEGSGPLFDVPVGIAFTELIYLPLILRN